MAPPSILSRQKMKANNPEKYQAYLLLQKERARQYRQEKKRKWEEEIHTRSMIEEREREKEAGKKRNQLYQSKQKRATRGSSNASTPTPTRGKKPSEMTPNERRAYQSTQRRDQRARQSHQKKMAQRKKNADRMRQKRADANKSTSRLNIVLASSSKAMANFSSLMKKQFNKKSGDPTEYASLVNPRSPRKKAAVAALFGSQEVRRRLNLDAAPVPNKVAVEKFSLRRHMKKRVNQRKAHLKTRIQAFYMKLQISRLLPHKRYATKYGAAYLITTPIRVAHRMFMTESGQTVSLSWFASLRPRNVRKIGPVPVDTCQCTYCTNISDPAFFRETAQEAPPENEAVEISSTPDDEGNIKVGDFIVVTYICSTGKKENYHGVVVQELSNSDVYPDVVEIVPVGHQDDKVAHAKKVAAPIVNGPQIKLHGAGNLTGDLRKVKDLAADMHNLVSKWESLNSQGMNILTDMANIMIEKVFNTEDEEINHRKDLPLKLQPLCNSLEQVVESMEYIVNKMAQKLTLAEGLVSLQQFKRAKPICQVLFLTMTLEDVASMVKAIETDYKKEVMLKREIYQSIAHSCDRDTTMFHLASWMHQPYIHIQTSDLLQALIKDTGHVK